jgi:hypothetical protein
MAVCIANLWTSVHELCDVWAPDADLDAAQCPATPPQEASVCTPEGLSCDYYGGGHDVHAECIWGLWNITLDPFLDSSRPPVDATGGE